MAATNSLPVFLTVPEVGALLRKSPKAIYAMIERHHLPGATRVRGRLLIRQDALLQWLDQQVVAASAKE